MTTSEAARPLTVAHAAAEQRRHRRFWTAIIVGFLSIDLGMAVTAIVLAHNAQAAVVIPDYYQKSLEWDARKAEAARSAAAMAASADAGEVQP